MGDDIDWQLASEDGAEIAFNLLVVKDSIDSVLTQIEEKFGRTKQEQSPSLKQVKSYRLTDWASVKEKNLVRIREDLAL